MIPIQQDYIYARLYLLYIIIFIIIIINIIIIIYIIYIYILYNIYIIYIYYIYYYYYIIIIIYYYYIYLFIYLCKTIFIFVLARLYIRPFSSFVLLYLFVISAFLFVSTYVNKNMKNCTCKDSPVKHLASC